MTNEELLEQAKTNPSCMDELIEKNRGIVYKIASRYYTEKTASIDFEDLLQEGYIGLLVAAQKYDPFKENAAKFLTYAIHYIRGYISRFLERRNTNEEVSLNKSVKGGDGDEFEMLTLIEDPDDRMSAIEHKLYCRQLREDLEGVMDEHLTLFEREILKQRYGWDGTEEMTISQIADLYQSEIHLIVTKRDAAIRKIRRSKWGAQKLKEHYDSIRYRKYDYTDNMIYANDYKNRFSRYLGDDPEDDE